MLLSFFGFAAIGKLLIYLFQQFPLTRNFKIKFFAKLFDCDLCLGVWIYFVLSVFFHFVVMSDVFGYIPLVSEVVTAAITTFVVHLISLGWRTKFEVFEIK